MFRSRTVFVVGAGASCELGLPSGNALKAEIATALDMRFETFGRQLTGDTRIAHALHQHVGGQISNINPYLHKAWQIRDAMETAISIDNYLDAHQGDKELEICGKLGIVRCILSAENKSPLKRPNDYEDKVDVNAVSKSWLLPFIRALTEGVRRADVETIFDNVSFIVFNYDRCIERYIVPALANYYNLSDNEAVTIVHRLRIYHPYGQVGPLPWQSVHGVPFGAADQADLMTIANGIKTFTEGQDDQAVIGPIHRVMSEAQTLVFLGFAYHQQNIDLITPGEMQVQRTFGSTRGISGSDTIHVADSLRRMMGLPRIDALAIEHSYNIDFHPSTCAGLFEEFSRGLTAPPQ